MARLYLTGGLCLDGPAGRVTVMRLEFAKPVVGDHISRIAVLSKSVKPLIEGVAERIEGERAAPIDAERAAELPLQAMILC